MTEEYHALSEEEKNVSASARLNVSVRGHASDVCILCGTKLWMPLDQPLCVNCRDLLDIKEESERE